MNKGQFLSKGACSVYKEGIKRRIKNVRGRKERSDRKQRKELKRAESGEQNREYR